MALDAKKPRALSSVATATEKDAQADYEQFMADSATQRAESAQAITDKEASRGM